MATHLIGYDLNRPRGADDYPKLIDAIKSLGTWWHSLDSTWIILSDLSCEAIRDFLKSFIDSGDELLVVKLNGEGAWVGFGQRESDWLMGNL